MIKREIQMPVELIEEITNIVNREDYFPLKEAFPHNETLPSIFLSQDEAEALIELAVIEKKKARLKYPYYDDEHPKHSQEHEKKFDDIQIGIYEKTIYYVESAFPKINISHLI